MTRHTIPVGRILGIPVGLDYSWFLIFGLLTWTLAVGYFPAEFTGWPPAQYWLVGAATACLFFVSVLLHELAHSVVALRYQVPVRSITLFIFGGVAQIGGEPPSAIAELWIAIAGPAMSFALAALFSLLQPLFAGTAPLLALAKYLAYINGVLALFNLTPAFPCTSPRPGVTISSASSGATGASMSSASASCSRPRPSTNTSWPLCRWSGNACR